MATSELLGTSNPRKEATRTSPHQRQSRGKIESCLPNDTKLRISTEASDQVQCSTGRCATILPTQCCPQDGWMLVQCVQINLPESSLAHTHHGPRLYVCQAPNAFICVSSVAPPKHQMRLYVCHQMRLYVCHQMRLYVCHQMRLLTQRSSLRSLTLLASLARFLTV